MFPRPLIRPRQRGIWVAHSETGATTALAVLVSSGLLEAVKLTYGVFVYAIARLTMFSHDDSEPPRHLLVPIAAFAGLTLHALRTGTAELESLISQALLGMLMLLASYYVVQPTRSDRLIATAWMGAMFFATA